MSLMMRHVTFGYHPHKHILENIHFEVNPGEIVSIVGPSGSGKSTLASIASGIKSPQKGEVLIDGTPIEKCRGFKPVQCIRQHPEKSINPRWRVHKILNEAGPVSDTIKKHLAIEDTWMQKWPHELSGGQLQRICIARALQPQLKYLIADEMTTMLDAVSQLQILTYLKDVVRETQIGLLFISHDKALVERYSDRVEDIRRFKDVCLQSR